jgi:hypothetical protein
MVGGVSHIGPLKIHNESAEAVKTNPFTDSVTKFITAVPVASDEGKMYVLCDSPGFEDS